MSRTQPTIRMFARQTRVLTAGPSHREARDRHPGIRLVQGAALGPDETEHPRGQRPP